MTNSDSEWIQKFYDNQKEPKAMHTPTPWQVPASNREGYERVKMQGIPSLDAVAITEANNKAVCIVFKKEDAAFIVRACNSHEKLVEALQFAIAAFEEIRLFKGEEKNNTQIMLEQALVVAEVKS